MINKSQQFGEYEISADSYSIISKSKPLPFQIDDSIDTDENIRLKYRYLDLRREDMKRNIVARSNTFKSIRNSMDSLSFLELDTPTLTKSTPEGAKDFLVPSRKQSGSFYALPQSPQMYKQLFMISGFNKYYQIAKCYRDEDSRKDRQPEFTQLDLEIFKNTEINFIKSSLENSGFVKGFHTSKIMTRSEIDALDELVKDNGSNGLGWFKIENSTVSGPLSKITTDKENEEILKLGDGMLLFQSGNMEIYPVLDIIRREIFTPVDTYSFTWIYDFPYFEVENGEIQPSHHPFTSPKDTENFIEDPNNATALHYDLVLNGSELGSGSQRINSPDIQRKVLEMWGLSDDDIENRFGWFIEALSYGTPQHAGIALGIDRIIAVMLNVDSIRDVIPFPKTQSGLDPLTNAPTIIDENELEDYNLKYIEVADE
jgi:aspartyl-tRNA synthetase